jgi:PAS domain-containing protein
MEITNVRSQLLIASEQVTVYAGHAQNVFAKVRASVANGSQRLHEAIRAAGNDLRNWLESILEAIVVPSRTITVLSSQLFVALKPLTVHLHAVQNTFGRLRTSVADEPRRLQEAIRARESDLPRLLESSPDAIVLLNTHLRFVASNPKASDVFGISQKNMKMFAMDAFLPRGQIVPGFDDKSALFITRKEWHGECQIRRLDGSLRVAEFIFVANYLPFLHLCMFRNERKWQRPTQFAA